MDSYEVPVVYQQPVNEEYSRGYDEASDNLPDQPVVPSEKALGKRRAVEKVVDRKSLLLVNVSVSCC